MPAIRPRSLNPMALEAAKKLGMLVAIGRRERVWSQVELAERVGTTAKTIHQIEVGEPTVGIGLYLQAAVLTGVRLFDAEPGPRTTMALEGESNRLALLPKRIDRRKFDNDF
jgi:DNA-binding XRE family transcriptional regulator